ncbi:helix-turn-helix transcriptional regulator [Occallatibacter savannae]|uniref:helix-turn-helix transcriptional regulator n=1 Tax=Occallatibacter savannae TaxID=1002691 RepID=UPI000D69ECBD
MGTESPRITGPTLKVIGAFLSRPVDKQSGVEISKATGLASGTLYPLLFRLEEAGWLQSEWEAVVPSEVKRPRRRLYRMTAVGSVAASESVKEHFPQVPEFAL